MRSPALAFIIASFLILGCVSVDVDAEPTTFAVQLATVTPGPRSQGTPGDRPLLRPSTPTPLPTPAATPQPGCASVRTTSPTPAPNATPPASNGRLVAPRLEVTEEPFTPRPEVRDADLERAVRQALGEAADDYSVYVKELERGRTASVNADRIFYSASLYKLFVMYEVFRQAAHRLIDLDEVLIVTPHYDAYAFSPRATQLCQSLPVRDLLQTMMSVSDNAAGVLLMELVGSWNVNTALDAFGMPTFRILEDDLPLTVLDAALMLEAIVRGEAVDRASSEAMLGLLATERIDNGVLAGLPAGTVVAHKTGNLQTATNQAAIVYSPEATYIIVALTGRGYETRYIRAVSEAVYRYFNPER